jgi:hypothetical protein
MWGTEGPLIKAQVHRGCEVPNPNANKSISNVIYKIMFHVLKIFEDMCTDEETKRRLLA